MPKQKTNKSVASRVKVTGTGKLLRRKAGKRHIMSKKTSKRKRQLSCPALVHDKYAKTYKKMMCLSTKMK